MEMMLKLTHSDIEKQLKYYRVMVEMWDQAKTFTGRPKYEKEFTELERVFLENYYKIFYRWYIHTGIPESLIISPTALQLLRRAIDFFGTL